jgi:HAMP domain-containing protein
MNSEPNPEIDITLELGDYIWVINTLQVSATNNHLRDECNSFLETAGQALAYYNSQGQLPAQGKYSLSKLSTVFRNLRDKLQQSR